MYPDDSVQSFVSSWWQKEENQTIINGLIIMTTSPSQPLSFPGLTGESRKALDARLRPAGMTGKR